MKLRVGASVAIVIALVFAAVACAKQRHHRHHHRVKHSAVLVPRGSGSTVAGPPLFGFNDNSSLMQQTNPEAAVERSEDVGATVIRYTVNWDYVEQTRGHYNWGGYDQLYRDALARDIRPILTVAFAPGWARPLDFSCGTDNAHCHDPPDTKYDADWARFAAAVAERYPKAAALEVWNEPNLIEFWRSGPDAGRYAQLTSLAYAAVKSKEPQMTVLGGALSNIQYDGNGSINFPKYLSDYLAAKPRFDALSMHDYDYDGGPWFDESLGIARSQLAAAGRRVQLWITEFGVTTTGSQGVAPQEQASRLVAYLADLGRRTDVAAALIHTMVPAPGDPSSRDYGFSVLNADGSPKPAYCALALARRTPPPAGCPRPGS